MGLKYMILTSLSSLRFVLKSDQNGIEIFNYIFPFHDFFLLKSDQNGIEILLETFRRAMVRALKSDQNGIEIFLFPEMTLFLSASLKSDQNGIEIAVPFHRYSVVVPC